MAITERRRKGGRGAGVVNRSALLASARHLFDTEGLAVPLSAIARHAGVGQGTLYRHFPDRRSLAVAVFEENVREFEELDASAGATVEDMLRLLTEHAVKSAAFVQLVMSGPRDEQLADLADRVTTIVVKHAANSGLPFNSAEDLMLVIGMVASVTATAPADQRREVAQRAWKLLGVSL